MMSSYYSNVVVSQSELIREVERHQETLRALTLAKNEAERANGAKVRIPRQMSHELRTPLNAVLGYSELLLEDAELEGRGEQIADLQKIAAAGKHLLAKVNDILDISKIEAGKMALHIETVDLAQLLKDVDATARPLATRNTNRFELVLGENLGTVRADATKLRQAIFNLLSNAAKIHPQWQDHAGRGALCGGRPRLGGVRVSDTGIGISPEHQKVLFRNSARPIPRSPPSMVEPGSAYRSARTCAADGRPDRGWRARWAKVRGFPSTCRRTALRRTAAPGDRRGHHPVFPPLRAGRRSRSRAGKLLHPHPGERHKATRAGDR